MMGFLDWTKGRNAAPATEDQWWVAAEREIDNRKAISSTQNRPSAPSPEKEPSGPRIETVWQGSWVGNSNWTNYLKPMVGKSAEGIHAGIGTKDAGTEEEEEILWGTAARVNNAEHEKLLTIATKYEAAARVAWQTTSDDAYDTRTERREDLDSVLEVKRAVEKGKTRLNSNLVSQAKGLIKELELAGYQPRHGLSWER